ncbi:MAG: dihydroorotate dehydrogenase electron transfer subunit [Desulfobulbaceae bacterium]|nr:dihydroorotate dehydrogenase electron transfer subunit [Desulfobulbaceae bacterium]
MFQETCRVIRLESLSSDTRRLVVAAPTVARDIRAGQFVMLAVAASYDPLLRRPFSAHFAEGDELTLYFRIVGKGTELLARVQPGDELPLLGPLGKGFSLSPAPAILVGGGIGIAPLLLLAKELAKGGNRAAAIVLAGRSAQEVAPIADSFKPWTDKLVFTTDDGSFGLAGRADAALSALAPACLSVDTAPGAMVYACGPQAMLKAVAAFCRDTQIRCQVSVESAMACGIGACLGCAKPATSGGYVHVCVDGPVFDAEKLSWN